MLNLKLNVGKFTFVRESKHKPPVTAQTGHTDKSLKSRGLVIFCCFLLYFWCVWFIYLLFFIVFLFYYFFYILIELTWLDLNLPESTWTQQLGDRTALVHEARCVCGSDGEGSGQVARWAFFLAANDHTFTHSLRISTLTHSAAKNNFYHFGLSDRVYLRLVIWGVRGPLPEPELLAAAALRVRSLQLPLQGDDEVDDDHDALASNPWREHTEIFLLFCFLLFFCFMLKQNTADCRYKQTF